MNKLFLMIAALLVLDSPSMAQEPDLTGVLKKAVKALSPYRLELDGATGSIYLRGEVLKDIPAGTRIWVKGPILTSLHDNRKDPTPAMPIQWHIYMDVKACKRIKAPFERPKAVRLQKKQAGATR